VTKDVIQFDVGQLFKQNYCLPIMDPI